MSNTSNNDHDERLYEKMAQCSGDAIRHHGDNILALINLCILKGVFTIEEFETVLAKITAHSDQVIAEAKRQFKEDHQTPDQRLKYFQMLRENDL